MKLKKLGSATVLIEVNGIKILCDPWLTDGIYYGSWFNFPPISINQNELYDIDFIYVSHIHPDHFDPKTMELLDKNTPVLIHQYHNKFLKANIERLGFNVVEIENRVKFDLGNGAHISIYAADNCDPSVCGYMFGCVPPEVNGSLQIDSLCVISNEEHILVNTNDCVYEIAKETLDVLKSDYPVIDFALVGYSSASLYPQCMIDYNEDQMKEGKDKVVTRALDSGLNILKKLKPKNFMPFAGTYVMGGSEYKKNYNRPTVELQDAVAYFEKDLFLKTSNVKGILLNNDEYFDIETRTQSKPYVEIDIQERNKYIKNVLSKSPYAFEDLEQPSSSELIELFDKSMTRLLKKQKELNLFPKVDLVFDLPEDQYISIDLSKTNFKKLSSIQTLEQYVRFKLDPRLLKMALSGPRLANWNNIEISGLLGFSRKPDEYRMDIHILLNSLHI